MEENKPKEPLSIGRLTMDIEKMLEESRKDYEKLGENPSYEDVSAYIMGIPREEYEKKIVKIAGLMGLSVEDYRKRQDNFAKNILEKQEEFIKTGNPVGVVISSNGEIIDEIPRTSRK